MRIGIITDIHENVDMLQEAIRLAEAQGCNEMLCLGDIVGFDQRFSTHIPSRSAKICIGLIRSNCRWVVAGNHDLHAAGRFSAYSDGFTYPSEWFEMTAKERKRASTGKVWCYEGEAPNDLDEDDLSYLQTLPECIFASFPGLICMLSHYLYPDLSGSTTRYIERNSQLQQHWKYMQLNQARLSFAGHSHAHLIGFAFPGKSIGNLAFLKAIHSVTSDSISLGNENMAVILPPLSGDKGRTGFSILDTDCMRLNIISTNIM